MKKLPLFLLGFGFALSLTACKTSSELAEGKLNSDELTNSELAHEKATEVSLAGGEIVVDKITGEWETYALEINGENQEICESNIKIEKSQNALYSISGDSGVNRYFGSAKISKNSFLVQDNLASTKMAGDPKSMAFEDNFTKVLLDANLFKLYKENDSDFLLLENKSGTEKIIFIRSK